MFETCLRIWKKVSYVQKFILKECNFIISISRGLWNTELTKMIDKCLSSKYEASVGLDRIISVLQRRLVVTSRKQLLLVKMLLVWFVSKYFFYLLNTVEFHIPSPVFQQNWVLHNVLGGYRYHTFLSTWNTIQGVSGLFSNVTLQNFVILSNEKTGSLIYFCLFILYNRSAGPPVDNWKYCTSIGGRCHFPLLRFFLSFSCWMKLTSCVKAWNVTDKHFFLFSNVSSPPWASLTE